MFNASLASKTTGALEYVINTLTSQSKVQT